MKSNCCGRIVRLWTPVSIKGNFFYDWWSDPLRCMMNLATNPVIQFWWENLHGRGNLGIWGVDTFIIVRNHKWKEAFFFAGGWNCIIWVCCTNIYCLNDLVVQKFEAHEHDNVNVYWDERQINPLQTCQNILNVQFVKCIINMWIFVDY